MYTYLLAHQPATNSAARRLSRASRDTDYRFEPAACRGSSVVMGRDWGG
jgi:hypothetical protein